MKGKMLILSLAVLFSACAFISARAAEAPLSVDAQQALNKGLEAAKLQDWELAISHFIQAQKDAERNPRILYSLGLAHARAGHGPAGTAWLRAYLAAAPAASDAAAVKEEIGRLKAVAYADMKKIFAAALAAARQVPSVETRKLRMLYIFMWQANAGDLDEARKTKEETLDLWVSLSPDDETYLKNYYESILWGKYIHYLSGIGEVQKAQDLVVRVEDWKLEKKAHISIAKGRTWIGDFVGAEEILAKVDIGLKTSSNMCIQRIVDGRDNPDTSLETMKENRELALDMVVALAENGQADDYRRVLKNEEKLIEKYKLGSEIRSKVAAALAIDPNSKARRVPLNKMDQVKEWIDLARETCANKTAVDLKGQLLWAKEDNSSDGLANGLGAVAFSLGFLMNKIDALEKKCILAAEKR